MAEVVQPTHPSSFEEVSLTPGSVVGEYRIESKLAAGGMGTVYAAVHPIIGKRAAIKVLKTEHSRDAGLIQRFIDEARAVNHIGHEHIVDIFAFGTLPDGRSYFVMEWLVGESLKQAFRRRPIPFLETVEILTQLCDALHAAHVKGIIHRDLKPDNVFLEDTRGGQSAKLLDFGIAKLSGAARGRQASASADTNPDVVMGTPDYISPEQASGADTFAPADCYSLGVIAYELLTKKRPFYGSGPMEVLIKHVSTPPPPPRSIRPDIPPSLEGLVLSMLAKDPGQRPTVPEVRDTLEEMARVARVTSSMPRRPNRAFERPVLVRSAERLTEITRPLLSELSAGACWVDANGQPPAVGTPMVLRFEVPRLDGRFDFDGVVTGLFGAQGERTLIRYDRVSKRVIDAVVELTSVSTRGVTTGSAEWREGTRVAESPWVAFLSGDEPDSDREEEGSGPTIPVSRPSMPPITRTDEATVGTPEAPTPPPRRFAWLGLGARMLAITVFIAVCAVASVAFVALRQARIDREFYVQDQNLTTARALAEAMEQTMVVWQKQLELTLSKGVYEGPKNEFSDLATCKAGACRSVFGTSPSPAIIEELVAQLGASDLAIRSGEEELWVAAGRRGSWATARVDGHRLNQLADTTPNVDLAVVGRDGGVVTTHGPRAVPNLGRHAFVKDVVGDERPDGASLYTADGQSYLGSFSRAGPLTLVVVSPLAVTVDQIGVLARQVTLVAAVVLGVAILLALLLSTTTTSRLRRLAAHARRVARGDFAEMPKVSGRDEVSELARYFQDMTRALQERDEQVLAAQRAASADEARAVQRSLSQWLQQDLASRLAAIQAAVEEEPRDSESHFELRKHLRSLSAQATNSLQSALLFASTSRQRIDVATAVRESVHNLENRRPAIQLSFSAPNAVLFPWIEADDSRLRETVLVLVREAIDVAESRVDVRLHMDGEDRVVLTVTYDGPKPSAAGVARRVGELSRDQTGEVRIAEDANGRPAIVVRYETRTEGEA